MINHRLLTAVGAAGAVVFSLAVGGSAVAAAESTVADFQAGPGCDPNYEPCVPIAEDVNCDDLDGPVNVIMSDIYGLDRDGDDQACEDGDADDGGAVGDGAGSDDGATAGGTDDGAGTDDEGLAATGSSSFGLVGVGAMTLLAGAVVLLATRRRTA